MSEVFDWDQDDKDLIRKAVQEREDLDPATENLKEKVEEKTSDVDFNQWTYEKELRDHRAAINSIQQTISPELKKAKSKFQDLEDREDERDFKQNKQDNAVDWRDYKAARELAEKYRRLFSQVVLMWQASHNAAFHTEKAINIEQKQANQKEVLDQVNKFVEGGDDLGDRIGRAITDSLRSALSDVVEEMEPPSEVSDLKSRINELESELNKAKNSGSIENTQVSDGGSGNGPDRSDLTSDQRQFLNLAEQGKSASEIANRMAMQEDLVEEFEKDLRREGFDISVT